MANTHQAPDARNVRMVGLWTFCSRVLGLVRDAAMAASFGNGPILDAFTVAFRIPNLTRGLFGEGALTAAFLPRFVAARDEAADTGWRLLSNTLVSLAAVLTGAILLVELVFAVLIVLLPPDHAAQRLLVLSAILLPYCLLVCLVALFCAAMNGLHRFGWPAVIPIVLNVVWLAGLLLVPHWIGTADELARGIAVTILFAGIVQLATAWGVLHNLGYRFRPDRSTRAADWGLVWRAMLPVVAGLAVTQINALLDSFLAWGLSAQIDGVTDAPWWQPLPAGSASALYLAQRLYQFPIGVFGVALATILFPQFTRHVLAGDERGYHRDVRLGVGVTIAVGLPAGAGLYCLSEPLAAACFQYGAFDAEDAAQTARAIAAYSIGVWAYCALITIHRAFYAIDDRVTPVWIGVWAVGLNLLLNLLFVWPLKEAGLALATAVAASVQAIVALAALSRRIDGWSWRPLLLMTAKTLIATSVMVAVCLSILFVWPPVSTASQIAAVLVVTLAGAISYAAVARAVGLDEFFWLLHRGKTEE